MRARDLGIVIGNGIPGPSNSLTDVPGVLVGHCTLIEGSGALRRGSGPVRTGVTVVLPHDEGMWRRQVFAGAHTLNGNGEMTGLAWVRECGTLTSPIGLTNTQSVGVVRDELAAVEVEQRSRDELFWSLPVVAETWDGVLNDANGFHVRPEHVREAMSATSHEVAEGSVGSGTGMICHGFKGGIGTASRVVASLVGHPHTIGVLVQANHGQRSRLAVNGAPVGRAVDAREVAMPSPPESSSQDRGSGSIIVLVATDAPLLPHQCRRLAQRASLGVARTGGAGEHSSGDLFLAFATGNRIESGSDGSSEPRTQALRMLPDALMDPLFHATIEATEEAIVNALIAAETMTGRDDVTAHALPHDLIVAALDKHGLRNG